MTSIEKKGEYGELAMTYASLCSKEGREINKLLFNKLHAATKEYKEKKLIKLICIGKEKESFLNRIKDIDLLLLMHALQEKNTQLLLLDLSYNSLTDKSAEIFSSFFYIIRPLKKLILINNYFTPKGSQQLINIISSYCIYLHTLNLSYNNLGREGGEEAAKFIQKNKSIKFINLKKCSIDLHALVHITTALQQYNQSIESLNLEDPSVSFNSQHAYHLAGVIKLCNNLKHLEISKQYLRDDGIELIAPFLLQNKTLKSLGLGANQITWRGAAALSQVLSASTPLEFLDLSYNKLNDYGVFSLCPGLESNTTLQVLLLNTNGIKEKGFKRLADALALNCTLQALGIGGNNLDKKTLNFFISSPWHFMRSFPPIFDLTIQKINDEFQPTIDTRFLTIQQTATQETLDTEPD